MKNEKQGFRVGRDVVTCDERGNPKVKCLVLEGDYEYFGFKFLDDIINSTISGTAILEINFDTMTFKLYDEK